MAGTAIVGYFILSVSLARFQWQWETVRNCGDVWVWPQIEVWRYFSDKPAWRCKIFNCSATRGAVIRWWGDKLEFEQIHIVRYSRSTISMPWNRKLNMEDMEVSFSVSRNAIFPSAPRATGTASQHGPSHSDPHLHHAWLLPQSLWRDASQKSLEKFKNPRRWPTISYSLVVTPFNWSMELPIEWEKNLRIFFFAG